MNAKLSVIFRNSAARPVFQAFAQGVYLSFSFLPRGIFELNNLHVLYLKSLEGFIFKNEGN